MKKSDHLDIVSAIWILASNDETFLISYEGIRFRLGIPAEINVRELVKCHGELFRQSGPPNAVEEWKQDLLNGKNNQHG